MKQLRVLTCMLLLLPFFVSAQNPKDTILKIMMDQQECWNKGDLDCFMVGYWETDSLMFIGKEKVHYGFDNTLKRYQNSYPNQESMGQLKFEFVSMQPLSETSFYVVGKYHLTRTIGDLQGHFTLLWRKIAGKWVIVADHSS